jgi:hypothetical protein
MRAILGLTMLFSLLSAIPVYSAGSLAVGKCSRFGYAFNDASPSAAAGRALAECSARGDVTCRIVAVLSRSCGAFAIDGGGGCHARGWASAGNRGAAEALALAECRKNGGQKCRIHGAACDNGP